MIIHSGLPRSGTNLLKNILSQNDSLKISHESIVCNIVESILKTSPSYQSNYYSEDLEDLEILLKTFIKGGVNNIDCEINQKHINHNKGWTTYIPSMTKLGYKTIFSVRNVIDILYSFEKQNEKHLSYNDSSLNLNCKNPLIGMLEKHEYEGFFQNAISFLNEVSINLNKYKDSLLIIRYEDLINDPKLILKKVYQFIEVDYFEHDLSNIMTKSSNDMHVRNRLGISHKVRPSLDNFLQKNEYPDSVKKYFSDKYSSITNLLGYT